MSCFSGRSVFLADSLREAKNCLPQLRRLQKLGTAAEGCYPANHALSVIKVGAKKQHTVRQNLEALRAKLFHQPPFVSGINFGPDRKRRRKYLLRTQVGKRDSALFKGIPHRKIRHTHQLKQPELLSPLSSHTSPRDTIRPTGRSDHRVLRFARMSRLVKSR